MRLGIALADHEEREFEDGEHKSRPLTNVRGRDVYVLQSLYGDAKQSVNDKLCRLLFFIGALKDASAARVTAVVPYLGYARKDRRSKARDPVTTRYVAMLFEAVGTDCVLTLDVHNLAAYQNAFRCRTEHLEANPLFIAHLLPLLRDAQVSVVSPDAGGIKRADAFRQRLSAALKRPVGGGICREVSQRRRRQRRSAGRRRRRQGRGHRRRPDQRRQHDRPRRRRVPTPRCHSRAWRGDARCFCRSRQHRAWRLRYRCHRRDRHDPALRVTDPRLKSRLTQVSAAPLFAEAIRRLHTGGSIVELVGG